MIALLYVFENEGLTLLDLAEVCGFYLATASRGIRAFAGPDEPGAKPPALGLVELRASPRGKTVHLTPAGRAFRAELQAIIAEASPIDEGNGAVAGSAIDG